jgi:tetratricopeptide (TPR) repeat protein
VRVIHAVGDKEVEAVDCGNLGDLSLERNDFAEARKWFEQELLLAREVQYSAMVAHAQFGAARIWAAEGRTDLAIQLGQEALNAYERLHLSDSSIVREFLQHIERASDRQGDHQGQTS